MAQTTVYIKAERNTQMQTDDVFLKDIASLYCEDKAVLAKVKAVKLHTFHEKGKKRFFISMTEVVRLIKEAASGVEVEDAEDAIYNQDMTDMADLVVKVVKEAKSLEVEEEE